MTNWRKILESYSIFLAGGKLFDKNEGLAYYQDKSNNEITIND
jgi:hypothetical protein